MNLNLGSDQEAIIVPLLVQTVQSFAFRELVQIVKWQAVSSKL